MGQRQMSSWSAGAKWVALQVFVNNVLSVIIEVYLHCIGNKEERTV